MTPPSSTSEANKLLNVARQQHGNYAADIVSSIPLDILIGGSCFAASAICLYRPELAPTIIFFFVGCAAFVAEVWVKEVAAPSATKTVSNIMTHSLQSFVSKENNDDTDRLLDAVSGSIARALQSKSLVSTVKSTISETIQDDDLQSAVISTLQSALVKVSQNEGFQNTTMEVTRRAFLVRPTSFKVSSLLTSLSPSLLTHFL